MKNSILPGVETTVAGGAAVAAALLLIAALVTAQQPHPDITRAQVADAEALAGLSFTDAKRDSMLEGLADQRANYDGIRSVRLDNSIPPALIFSPLPPGTVPPVGPARFRTSPIGRLALPADSAHLAFLSVGELGVLLRERKVTSVALTRLFLSRLKKYDAVLHCVVTLTEERALRQAAMADEEIARGRSRGPLHGVPYGAKDLLAVRGTPTTWGSVPYRDQVIDRDATVIRKLDEAGAILIAKMSVGELAWGDVWFGGMTRNPWKTDQGSSGSSAGSAAATSAGLVPFAIGTETYGSIVSPATRCGVTGLRPTFGRVSRSGAMALSWSMDKIGVLARQAEDCALVLRAIAGPDGEDPSVISAPVSYDPDVDLRRLRIGYLKEAFDSSRGTGKNDSTALAVLRTLGATLVPIALPRFPINDISIILSAEAGAAFDELTRGGKDDLLVRQIKNAWPNVFRLSRFIPAVEYIQANRIRTLVIAEMQKLMSGVDLYVAPTFGGDELLLTNLTGHPSVVVPHGFSEEGTPTSITFTGRLFDEGRLLAVARKYQEATGFHRRHPKGFGFEEGGGVSGK